MFFIIFITVVVLQRLAELYIARKNEAWLKERGGIEFGRNHYAFMVAIHVLFFISLLSEVTVMNKQVISFWPWLLFLFLLTQLGRIWALSSLGRYWNTKIIVVPDAHVIQRGPYRLMRHPNYVIVTLEIIIIPLLFQAYGTLLSFTLLNALILMIRIPAEEQALGNYTRYSRDFNGKRRFLPILKRL